jgi:hypothetical protein
MACETSIRQNRLSADCLKTMEVYPIKDYGAIETGQHTFSHMENGQLQAFTYKFMQIWQKKDGVWRVTREITYGH